MITRHSADFNKVEISNISPSVLLINEQRLIREDEILADLVMNFNKKVLTEKEAFLAICEIAVLRNLLQALSKSF